MKRILQRFCQFAILVFALGGLSVKLYADDALYIIMLGAPGAGKSVNSELFSSLHNVPWLHFGEEVKRKVEAASEANFYPTEDDLSSIEDLRAARAIHRKKNLDKALEDLKQGKLVDNDSLNVIAASAILTEGNNNGFILDGYPMTVKQAEVLDEILVIRGVNPSELKVVYLNVTDEIALERMQNRGRADDHDGFAEERLKQFRRDIVPLLEYYGDSVVEIDGSLRRDQVTKLISDAIK